MEVVVEEDAVVVVAGEEEVAGVVAEDNCSDAVWKRRMKDIHV